jgi:hypothetical protein
VPNKASDLEKFLCWLHVTEKAEISTSAQINSSHVLGEVDLCNRSASLLRATRFETSFVCEVLFFASII